MILLELGCLAIDTLVTENAVELLSRVTNRRHFSKYQMLTLGNAVLVLCTSTLNPI